ncbi:HalOD1 output domain-containing protein [Halorubrum sp. AD140]|uniref:HalOD1 output domain-containing protein n=1 Tax=Halorubrum sp. AD140 TaxID=3050073 RepID=UPI002ACCF67B|nr:HalOD1 output domain-containing protein [Halorubrum sp. AD140]MDZ5810473.1 HalOD1 output domain-containing protein [Halorubrum sp. AD140]
MTTEDTLHRIVSAIDELDDRDVRDLPLLYDSVDPQALESLVASGVTRIEFEHAEYRIVITNGEVTVHEQNG